MSDKYDVLKLDNQICFPLYAVSKEIVRKYTPFLNEINLTYTQYIAMMVMWEHREVSVKELGKKLFLDSGTLTPLLKNLEKKRLIPLIANVFLRTSRSFLTLTGLSTIDINHLNPTNLSHESGNGGL